MPNLLKSILAITCIAAIPFVLMLGMADTQAEREKLVAQAQRELTACLPGSACYVKSLGTWVFPMAQAKVKGGSRD
jgi:hypothetical protein